MKMGNEKIRTVAMDNFKNDNSKRVLFVDFMELRFPEEGHIPYIQEWADRFKTGHPTTYMDEQSQRDYKIVSGINGEEPKTEETYNTPLSRDIIRSGGTNADYPITLCESITTETKKQHWDTSYMIGKARVLIDFLTNEQNRANSISKQGRTEEVIKQDKDWRERIAKEKDK